MSSPYARMLNEMCFAALHVPGSRPLHVRQGSPYRRRCSWPKDVCISSADRLLCGSGCRAPPPTSSVCACLGALRETASLRTLVNRGISPSSASFVSRTRLLARSAHHPGHDIGQRHPVLASLFPEGTDLPSQPTASVPDGHPSQTRQTACPLGRFWSNADRHG